MKRNKMDKIHWLPVNITELPVFLSQCRHLLKLKTFYEDLLKALLCLLACRFISGQHPIPYFDRLQCSGCLSPIFKWTSPFLLYLLFLFLIGIHSMQGSTATTRHGLTRKRSTKRSKHTVNLFRKNLQLKDVC